MVSNLITISNFSKLRRWFAEFRRSYARKKPYSVYDLTDVTSMTFGNIQAHNFSVSAHKIRLQTSVN